MLLFVRNPLFVKNDLTAFQKALLLTKHLLVTAQKMSLFGVILVRIFPAFSRIRTEYGEMRILYQSKTFTRICLGYCMCFLLFYSPRRFFHLIYIFLSLDLFILALSIHGSFIIYFYHKRFLISSNHFLFRGACLSNIDLNISENVEYMS